MRRLGVAAGQTITKTANPVCCLLMNQGVPTWTQLEALLRQWRPDALVVGLPLDHLGAMTAQAKHAEAFAAQLQQRFSLPVFTIDEHLSSQAAQQQLHGRNKVIQKDSYAAKLILESWMMSV